MAIISNPLPLTPDNVSRQIDPSAERLYTLSIGKSRRAVYWDAVRMTWREVVERLSTPVRTRETVAEYQAMTKDDQVDAKDVGGYVAGELRDGRRKKANLLYRSLLSLDLDSATDFRATYDRLREVFPVYSFILHTTHSHTQELQRLRLVMPLSRDVTREEYTALATRVAELVGEEQFDPTTDQAERLMFWPSCPKDGEFLAKSFAGNPMEVDKWLTGEDPFTQRHRVADRAEDPTTKRGIVGCFCRAYSIYDVLGDLLAGVYAPTGSPNRWTYADGHTTGGAIVYDDGKYLYSYHATDPAEGRLLNSFDLVRIHRYGSYDVTCGADVPMTEHPSYGMMCDFAGSLERVKKEQNRELMAQVSAGDFSLSTETSETTETPDDYDPMKDEEEFADWASDLIYKVERSGRVRFDNSHFNVIKILENDKRIRGSFARDTFHDRAVVTRDLPWRAMQTGAPDYVTDDDVSQLRSWLSSHYYKIDNRQIIDDSLITVESRYAFHPIKRYLEGLTWDGVPRAEELIIRTLGADDTPLNRAMTIRWLKAAVARIFHPGVKFDNMLVLVGKTGCGKSTLLERLGREWYSGTLVSLDNIRQASAQMQGAWIIEDPELVGIMSSGVANAKGFLSKTTDDFIAPYGRHKVYRKRQCVFAGTTNEHDFLRDSTGERRYWVILVQGVEDPSRMPFTYLTSQVVDQIWAEVLTLYKSDPTLILSRELEEQLREVQKAYKEIDVWEETIQTFLDMPVPVGYRSLPIDTLDGYYYNAQGVAELDSEALEERTVVCFDDICRWALGFRIEGRIPRDARKRVNRIMSTRPDWEPTVYKDIGSSKAKRGWRRKA
jgi:predicted P-loop ATPase